MISIFLISIDTAAAVRVLSSLVIEKKAKGVIPRVIREIFFLYSSLPLSSFFLRLLFQAMTMSIVMLGRSVMKQFCSFCLYYSNIT